jgi:transketolase
VREAWKIAIENRQRPTVLALTRQAVPTLDRSVYASEAGVRRGAYVLADHGTGKPKIILMASGSELALVVAAGKRLADGGAAVRVVSFPSWELFAAQDEAYRESVLPSDVTRRLAVEAGVAQGWHRWVGATGRVLSIERFGVSAPAKDAFNHLNMTVERTFEIATELLE